MRDFKFVAVLLAVSAFLFLFGLGDMALTDPDETFYAQTAREMHSANEWITPTIFGKPQFEKPILYYWLIELSYRAFGVNEFAARFPSALFGIIGVLGIFFMGKLLFSPFCGFLSGIIAATGVEYLILARGCVTDMVLAVFILLCLAFFIKGWLSQRGKIFYVLSSAMAAFAVLTKGPIGLFIPGMVALSYITAVKGWGRLKEIPFLPCIAVFALIAFPWYIAAARIHGQLFFNEFFGFQNITRFLRPEHKIGSSPWFYFPVVLGGFAPWTIFLLFAVWDMFRRGADGDSPLKGYRFFLLAWFLVVFIFFTISSTRLVTYIFPLFPVLAIVTGRFWERAISERSCGARAVTEKYLQISFALLGALCIAGVVAGFFLLKKRYPGAVEGMVYGSSIFAAFFALSVIFLFTGRRGRSFASMIVGILIGVLPVVYFVIPSVEKRESSREICAEFLRLSAPGEAIAGESDNCRGVAFYTGRTDVVDVHPQESLMEFISRKERVWCIMQKKHYARLMKDGKYLVPPPVFESGKRILITNKPLPQGAGQE